MTGKIRRVIERVKASSFAKSVLTLSSGVVVGQGINFVGMPFIGRIYTPGVIGDYSLITANSAVISAVACLGMMTVFMLPEEDGESRGLCRLVTLSTLVITSVAIAFLWLISPWFALFSLEETDYGLSLIILWLYVVLSTLNNICYAYINRQKKYRVLFWNPVFGASVNVGLGIVFGLIGWGFIGYTAARLISYAVNIVHLVLHGNPYAKIENPEHRNTLRLIREYRQFPIYQMPANLVANLSNQVPMQLISTLYSSATLGMYSMALRVLTLPTTLLATPINRVYFQEACDRFNKGEDVGMFSLRVLQANIKIGIIPICLLVIFGPQVFALFLGQQWEEAGTFASILGLFQLMEYCKCCLSGDFIVIRKNSWNLISALASLAIVVLIYIGFTAIGDAPVSMLLVALSVLLTMKTVAAQCVFFAYTGVKIRVYLVFLLKYVVIPFAASFALSMLIHLAW